MVRPGQPRRDVEYLKSHQISQRRACRLVQFSRSLAWRRLKGRIDGELRSRLKALAEQYPKYGYLTLHSMLPLEGRAINRKRTYRIYREEVPDLRLDPGPVRFAGGARVRSRWPGWGILTVGRFRAGGHGGFWLVPADCLSTVSIVIRKCDFKTFNFWLPRQQGKQGKRPAATRFRRRPAQVSEGFSGGHNRGNLGGRIASRGVVYES